MSMACANQPRPRVERRLSMPMMGSNRNSDTVAPSRPRASRRSSLSGFGFGHSDTCSSSIPEKYVAPDPEPEPTFTQAELDQKMKVIMRDKELWGEFKQKLAQSDSKAGLGLQIVMRNFLIDFESRIVEIEAEQDDTQTAVTTSSHRRAGLLKKPPRGSRSSSISSSNSSFFQRALSSLGGDSWQLEEELSEKDFGTSYNIMTSSNRQFFDQPVNINIHNVSSELDMDVSSQSTRSIDLSDIRPVAPPKMTQANIQSKNIGGDNSPSNAGKSIFRGASAIGKMFMFKRLEEEMIHSVQNSDSSLNLSSDSLNHQTASTHAIYNRSTSPSEQYRLQVQGEEDNKNIRGTKIVTPPPCEDENSDANEDNNGAVWLGWNSRNT